VPQACFDAKGKKNTCVVTAVNRLGQHNEQRLTADVHSLQGTAATRFPTLGLLLLLL
jgi:hypothetical protein